MGFRNPVTSAAVVDTRTPAVPMGVRVYVAPNPDGTSKAKGVLEWDDGVAGDVPAMAVQTVAGGAGPRNLSDPYGRLTVKGGSYNANGTLTAAPDLSVGVEQDAAGNPIPRGRLVGAAALDLGGAALVNSPTLKDTGWTPLAPAAPAGGSIVYRALNGWASVLLSVTTGATGVAAGATICTVPSTARASYDVWDDGVLFGNTISPMHIDHATGALTLGFAIPASSGFLGSLAYPIG